MLSLVVIVTMLANSASRLLRDSAFLSYSERPLVIPQYHGLTSLNSSLSLHLCFLTADCKSVGDNWHAKIIDSVVIFLLELSIAWSCYPWSSSLY
ncbi:hypothetical protein M758_4G180300 [Ceratodon purpureus]|nr:hypothetical protein M758_4G180300 [Ceratodon purpureus]